MNEIAIWHISLDVECPKCGTCFDLTNDDDFYHNFEPAEDAKDYEAVCPECSHEFMVDFEY